MRKIILSILIAGLLLSTTSFSFGEKQLFQSETIEIPDEIEELEDKTLVVDRIIADIHVKYWEHVVDGFLVKNDSILLHSHVETGDVIKYEICWTDLEYDLPYFRDDTSEFDSYLWKRKVVFPDEDDYSFFYSFYDPVVFPVFCWEVRYTDGTTILYDLNGERIGRGVQAPTTVTRGLTLVGAGDPDWAQWMHNAYGWYMKFTGGHVNSMGSPDNWMISKYVGDPECFYFYVIAHSGGLSTRFQSSGEGVYYTATMLHEAMEDRAPMKLAVLCCCSAMVDTGPGTLSYEFRKGEMADVVTIGYYNMGSCPGWPEDVYYWQDHMFYKMSRGYKMKKAFDLACASYPTVADYVKFVGDQDIKAMNAPPETYIYVHKLSGSYIGPHTIFDPPSPNKNNLEMDARLRKIYVFKATHPILHPSWPDTNDPDPDGGIVEYTWTITDEGGYNIDNDEMTSSNLLFVLESDQSGQVQSQNLGIDTIDYLELDILQGNGIKPLTISWKKRGNYGVTLTVKDNEGVTRSSTVTMHIPYISGDEQNMESMSIYCENFVT